MTSHMTPMTDNDNLLDRISAPSKTKQQEGIVQLVSITVCGAVVNTIRTRETVYAHNLCRNFGTCSVGYAPQKRGAVQC